MADPTPDPRFRLRYIRHILIFNAGALAGLVTGNLGWRVVQVRDHFDLRLFGWTVGAWARGPEWANMWGFLGLTLIGGVLAVAAYLLIGRLLSRQRKEKSA